MTDVPSAAVGPLGVVGGMEMWRMSVYVLDEVLKRAKADDDLSESWKTAIEKVIWSHKRALVDAQENRNALSDIADVISSLNI